ncbi:MAG: hypothetical protein QMD61_05135 [Methanobacterium sp.]|nr:hypothetical protein [Methanobacterium sp.]
MQKNIQKKLLMIIAILILSLAISGAVSAEDGTENNLTENDTLNQTLPDPRIEHNGVIGPTVYATIQDAINAAQSGDTIWLEDGATFTTGQVWRPAIVHVTKNLSFRVFNDGTATISGTNTRRAIYVDSGVTANFYNITITQGRSLNPLLYDGAGIFNNGGTVNLYNCILDNNDGLWRGGGIYNNHGTVRIENTIIRNNNVPVSGGAIYNNQGTVNIVSSTITGNSARNGGGIYNNDGTVTIENSNLNSNSVSGTGTNNGGAVYNDNGDLFIYGSNILNNAASNEGGAVYATTGTTNTIQYNRIIGNSDRVLYREGLSNIDARFNWWGSNTGPTSGMYRNANVSPYIRLTINPVGPTNLINTGTYLITAELFRDSSGGDHSGAAYHVPDGPISFSILPTVWGSLSNVDTVMTNAHAYATFNANSGARPTNPVVVQALVDNVAVTTAFNILPAADIAIAKEFRTDYQNSTSTTTTANYHTPIWVMIHVTNNGPDSVADLQITDILPAGLTYQNVYHISHDNGTTWTGTDIFNSGIWTIGDMSNGADYWLAILAQVDGHNETIENVANKTQTTFDHNSTNDEGRATLNIPPAADVFVNTTPSKTKLTVGETMVVRVKVGNNGPDSAQNVVVTYKIPAGMEFVSLTHEAGYPAPTYDSATRTVTWNLGDLGVIDPWMDITLRAVGAGTTSSDASVISDTYDPVPSNNVEAVTITVEQAKANAATVPMQPTGIPLAGLVLAVLMLSAGLFMQKRK